MKVRLLENNKIIYIPHWTYRIVDNKKVIIDQLGEIIGEVIEEND